MKAENFGKNLSEILSVLGVTQIELAEKTKLTQAAISQIIAGKRNPTLNSICAILKVVPVKFERLVK